MRENNVNDYRYVCPVCLNILKECKCCSYPPTLIQIDKNMLPIIKELNRKYILTEACCEGHVGSAEFMYITFKKSYKFKTPIPTGFFGNGEYIRADITGSTEQAKKRKKRVLLDRLYKWACELKGSGTNIFM